MPASPPAPAATTAPAAGVAPTAAPAAPAVSKAGGKVVLTRYMTGGYTTPGPDDALVKQFQEEAIRKEYGLNVDIQYESASWADIDQLMEVRLQTQAVDTLQRHDRAASRWISTPGMIRDIDAEVKQYGKNLLAGLPKAGWEYFMRDDRKYIAIPAMRSAVTDIAGSSDYFVGSLVTYSGQSKVDLGVQPEILAMHGLVSQQTAEAMARAARERLHADLGLGITGIAGGDELEGQPPGTMHIALWDGDEMRYSHSRYYQGRAVAKSRAVLQAMSLLREYLMERAAGAEG